jgi:hypothetical protein
MQTPCLYTSKVQNQFYRCRAISELNTFARQLHNFDSNVRDCPLLYGQVINAFQRKLAARCGIGERPQTAGHGATQKLRRYHIAINYSVHGLAYLMRAHRMLRTREFTKPNFPPVTRIEIEWLCQFSRKCSDRIFEIQSIEALLYSVT